jgi:hypothetical protein
MTIDLDDYALDAPGGPIDRWHDGALDAYRGRPKTSEDAHYLEGYKHALNERQVQVVEIVRPEGYYHMPLGSF